MVYVSLIVFIAAFCLWAYKAMIDIRPNVDRPKLDKYAHEIIDDIEGRVELHVRTLADEIGPRDVFVPDKLNAAADYIRSSWEKIGYEVNAQAFSTQGVLCQNLFIEIPGESKPGEIIFLS
jgi:hypothetical protein